MKFKIIFFLFIFAGIARLTLSANFKEHSDDLSLCQVDSNFEIRTSLTVSPGLQSKIQPVERGKYITQFKFQAYNEFDLFWYSTFIDPPIIGNNSKRVFEVGVEPQVFETVQTDQKSITIGKTSVSYAFLNSDFTTEALLTPVKGKYPLIGKSTVIQTTGEKNFFRRDTHFRESGNDQAIDLETSLGARVVSFGAGRVVYVEQRYHDEYACGMEHTESYSNHILVLQDDGHEALYGHLLRDSVVVEEGQRVEVGQNLGRTGCINGCSNGSHLHFSIGGLTEDGYRTVPVLFYTNDSDIVWEPQLNKKIESY